MRRGEPQYLLISLQKEQNDPLAGAPVTKKFDTIDELKRGIVDQNLNPEAFLIVESFPLAVSIEKKVVIA